MGECYNSAPEIYFAPFRVADEPPRARTTELEQDVVMKRMIAFHYSGIVPGGWHP